MTNGSGPHPRAGGKKKAAAAGGRKQKPATEVLTKGLKRKGRSGTSPSGS